MGSKHDIVGWRAWYSDGRTYDSETTQWEDLPSKGALVFVLYQRGKNRRRVMAGVTLYWKDGNIYACDNTGDADIRADLDSKFVKRGKWVTDEEFCVAHRLAWESVESPDESVRT